MKKEDLDKVLYELKSFLSEEDYEELMRRGQAILLDEKEGRNGFIEKPRIERVFLRVFFSIGFRPYCDIRWSPPRRDPDPVLQHI